MFDHFVGLAFQRLKQAWYAALSEFTSQIETKNTYGKRRRLKQRLHLLVIYIFYMIKLQYTRISVSKGSMLMLIWPTFTTEKTCHVNGKYSLVKNLPLF